MPEKPSVKLPSIPAGVRNVASSRSPAQFIPAAQEAVSEQIKAIGGLTGAGDFAQITKMLAGHSQLSGDHAAKLTKHQVLKTPKLARNVLWPGVGDGDSSSAGGSTGGGTAPGGATADPASVLTADLRDKLLAARECHELCVSGLAHAGFRYGHALKRSSNMIANWLRAANHSRTFLPPFSKLRMAR